MTRRQRLRFEMLRRVRDFGSIHGAQFPDGSVGGQAFDSVRAIVDDMGSQAMRKMATRQEGFRAKKQARLALDRDLTRIVRTAKVIARTTPRFDERFRLPKHRSDLVLLAAAQLFVEAAEQVAEEFIAHGMAETFVATLRAKRQQLEAAIAAREDGSRRSAAAQARIAASLTVGMDAVTRLDVVIGNRFADDVATLAQWTHDRHMRTASHRTDSSARSAAPEPRNISPVPVLVPKAVAGRAVHEEALRRPPAAHHRPGSRCKVRPSHARVTTPNCCAARPPGRERRWHQRPARASHRSDRPAHITRSRHCEGRRRERVYRDPGVRDDESAGGSGDRAKVACRGLWRCSFC